MAHTGDRADVGYELAAGARWILGIEPEDPASIVALIDYLGARARIKRADGEAWLFASDIEPVALASREARCWIRVVVHETCEGVWIPDSTIDVVIVVLTERARLRALRAAKGAARGRPVAPRRAAA